MHYIHAFVTFYWKDGPLRRSSEYFFVKCMLCDSKLNLYFVGNIKQQGGQLGEGGGWEGAGGWGVGVGQEEEEGGDFKLFFFCK